MNMYESQSAASGNISCVHRDAKATRKSQGHCQSKRACVSVCVLGGARAEQHFYALKANENEEQTAVDFQMNCNGKANGKW